MLIKFSGWLHWYIEVYESGIDFSLSLFDFCSVLIFFGFSLINYGYGTRAQQESVFRCIHKENRECDGFVSRLCPVSANFRQKSFFFQSKHSLQSSKPFGIYIPLRQINNYHESKFLSFNLLLTLNPLIILSLIYGTNVSLTGQSC